MIEMENDVKKREIKLSLSVEKIDLIIASLDSACISIQEDKKRKMASLHGLHIYCSVQSMAPKLQSIKSELKEILEKELNKSDKELDEELKEKTMKLQLTKNETGRIRKNISKKYVTTG